MSRVFMTGLEGQDLSVFTSKGAATAIATAQARTGAASLTTLGSTHWGRKTLPAAYAEFYFRFGLRWSFAADNGNNYIVRMYDSAAANQLNLALDADGILHAFRTFTNIDSGENAVSQDEWHCIEVHIVVNNTTGVFDVKVDGVVEMEFDGDTQATANANVQAIQFGSDTASHYLSQLWFDDIVVNSTAGAVNNSWPGQGGIYAIFPSGAGFNTGLTPDSGDNYARVNEAPPDEDTSYVQGTPTVYDSYAMGNLTPAAGTVSAICWHARAKLTEAGAGDIARQLRIAGTNYQGTDVALDVSYQDIDEILEASPDTSNPWTITEVNSMEAGVAVK